MWCLFSKYGYLLASFADITEAIEAFWRWPQAVQIRYVEVDLER